MFFHNIYICIVFRYAPFVYQIIISRISLFTKSCYLYPIISRNNIDYSLPYEVIFTILRLIIASRYQVYSAITCPPAHISPNNNNLLPAIPIYKMDILTQRL